MTAKADGICHSKYSLLIPASHLGLAAGWVRAPPTPCAGPGDRTAGAGGDSWGWASELGGIRDPGWSQACTQFLPFPVAPPVGLLLGATPPPWMLLPYTTYS